MPRLWIGLLEVKHSRESPWAEVRGGDGAFGVGIARADSAVEAEIDFARALLGFVGLARDFPTDTIEKACKTALKHNLWRSQSLRRLCRDNPNQKELPFMEEHPLIRGIDAYATIARFPHVSFRPIETPEESKE